MPLPTFKHFSYQDAAKELGVSLDKLFYLIEEEYIRYAVPMSRHQSLMVIKKNHTYELMGKHVNRLAFLENRDDLVKEMMGELGSRLDQLAQSPRDLLDLPPEYLYLRHSNIDDSTLKTNSEVPTYHAYFLETYEQIDVNLIYEEWYGDDQTRYLFSPIDLGESVENRFFTRCVITKEELDRVKGPEEIVLGKNDAVAQFLIKYLNMYLGENDGRKPTFRAALDFIQKRHNPSAEDFELKPLDDFGNRKPGYVQIQGEQLTSAAVQERIARALRKVALPAKSLKRIDPL